MTTLSPPLSPTTNSAQAMNIDGINVKPVLAGSAFDVGATGTAAALAEGGSSTIGLLPTPTSLPRSRIGFIHSLHDQNYSLNGFESLREEEAERDRTDIDLDEDAGTGMDRSGSEDNNTANGASGGEEEQTFQFDDVEMLNGNESDTPTPALAFPIPVTSNAFSSNVLIHRPFRARYARTDELPVAAAGSAATPSSTSADRDPSPVPTPSFKRTFEEISPPAPGVTHSLASTRPAPSSGLSNSQMDEDSSDDDDDDGHVGRLTRDNFSPFSTATSVVPRPHGHAHRHSFDSQRFQYRSGQASLASLSGGARVMSLRSDGDSSSGLRRRSPASSRAASRERERERERERRNLLSGDDADEGSIWGGSSDRSKRRRPSGTPEEVEEVTRRLAGPSSSAMAIDPALTTANPASPSATVPSTADRRSRLSFPSLTASPPTSSSSSSNSSPRPSLTARTANAVSLINGSMRDGPMRRLSTNSPATTRTEPTIGGSSTSMRRSLTSTSSSFPTFRRATTTSYQVSPPVVVGATSTSPAPASTSTPHQPPSGTTTALSPLPTGATVLRPRSARARPDPMREREFDPLIAFWREEREHQRRSSEVERQGRSILDEANVRLGRAERTLVEAAGRLDHHRSTGSLTLPSVPSTDPADMPQFPGVSHLPMPSRSNETRPTVAVRVGEGWGSRTRAPESTVAVDGSNGTAPSVTDDGLFTSPPSSPRSGDDSPLGTALHYLSNLRSRRPHLSRNATGVTPPEDSPLSTPDPGARLSETERDDDQSWWLLPMPEYNAEDEVGEAARLNERFLARRAAAEWDAPSRNESSTIEADSGPLWGDVAPSIVPSTVTLASHRPSGGASSLARARRMRGPTERANEQWRLGNGPNLASTATAPTTTTFSNQLSRYNARPTSSATDSAVPWRSGWWHPAADRDLTLSTTSASDRQWRAIPLNNGTETYFDSDFIDFFDEIAPWDEEDDRPRSSGSRSGRGGIDPRDRQRASFTSSASRLRPDAPSFIPADSFGTRTNSGDSLLDRDQRPSIRINPRPPSRGGASQAARASLGLEDDDDEWLTASRAAIDRERTRAPPSGPPGLPSGSLGRRIVFPHPAATSGAYPPSSESQSRTRYHPAFGFESTRYDTTASARAASAARSLPTNEPASPTSAVDDASHPTFGRLGHRRTSLADALAHFGARNDSNEGTLRRRHNSDTNARDSAATGADVGDRLLQRQLRSDRLLSLRRERTAVRAVMDGANRDFDATYNLGFTDSSPPRSPGGTPSTAGRRRGFGDLLRGFSGRTHGFGEEFSSFFGRDSAALDPRNYLDDDDFDASYESLLRLSERLGDVKPRGVSQDKLAALRKFPYREWPMPERKEPTVPLGVATTSAVTMDEDLGPFARKGTDKEERCAVCLVDYEEDDECTLGHCNHGFHSECLLAWLKERGTCPVCRKDHAV